MPSRHLPAKRLLITIMAAPTTTAVQVPAAARRRRRTEHRSDSTAYGRGGTASTNLVVLASTF